MDLARRYADISRLDFESFGLADIHDVSGDEVL